MIGLKRHSGGEQAMGHGSPIDMTNFIDILMLLLIFFLVNTNFIKETGIDVKRPEAATGEAKTGDLILVAVSVAGTIHMNGKVIDMSSVRPLVAQARSKTPKAPVVLVADEGTRMGLIVRVMDECKLAGANDISVSTRVRGA